VQCWPSLLTIGLVKSEPLNGSMQKIVHIIYHKDKPLEEILRLARERGIELTSEEVLQVISPAQQTRYERILKEFDQRLLEEDGRGPDQEDAH